MADWFAVYWESDGELLSLGTVLASDDDLASRGLAKINLGATQPEGGVWNTSTLVFDPTPARPPDVDRVDEVLAAMTKSGGRFSESEVRREVAKLLGPDFQFRGASEGRDLS